MWRSESGIERKTPGLLGTSTGPTRARVVLPIVGRAFIGREVLMAGLEPLLAALWGGKRPILCVGVELLEAEVGAGDGEGEGAAAKGEEFAGLAFHCDAGIDVDELACIGGCAYDCIPGGLDGTGFFELVDGLDLAGQTFAKPGGEEVGHITADLAWRAAAMVSWTPMGLELAY